MFDFERLRKRCLDPYSEFHKLGEVNYGPAGEHIYIDRGSDVLAVAHLDSVQNTDHFAIATMPDGEQIVYNGQLDDRLGVYIILDLLPTLGIVPDVLLTDGEEIGMSTAQDFEPTKEYNWMFQFDRTGTDVVQYEYRTNYMDKILRSYGFDLGWGSFSDICYLEHLRCKGMNVGCAYYNYHSERAHFVVSEAEQMIGMFSQFYRAYHNSTFPHTPTPYPYRSGYSHHDWNRGHWNDNTWYKDETRDNAGTTENSIVPYDGSNKIDEYFLLMDYYLGHNMRQDEASYVAWKDVFGEDPPTDQEMDLLRSISHDIPDDDDDYRLPMEFDEECMVCGQHNCPGVVYCEHCGAGTHGSWKLYDTGMCDLCRAAKERIHAQA